MHFFLHGGDSGAACSLSVPQWWALLAERPSVLSGVLRLCGPKEGCTIWDVWEDQVQCWQGTVLIGMGTVLIGMGTGAPSPTEGFGVSLGVYGGDGEQQPCRHLTPTQEHQAFCAPAWCD